VLLSNGLLGWLVIKTVIMFNIESIDKMNSYENPCFLPVVL